MTNEHPSDDNGAVDSESFEEWLDHAADSKGVSKQELMNQMLSSYWILDELSGLVGEAGSERGMDDRSSAETDSVPEPEEAEDARAGSEPIGSYDELAERAPIDERIRELQTAIRELAESESDSEERRMSDPPSTDDNVADIVADLRGEIETFGTKLEDLERRHESQFDRLSNELQLVLDRVDSLERDRDRFADEGDIDALTEEIRALDDRVERVRTDESDLESRMDREFDSIEALFHRVLNALDDLESDLESTTESYESELEPIKQRETERERLEELKNDALRRGVRKGSCESCNRDIDLALLESPECPNCRARFIRIGDSGWNPFRPPEIETERDPIGGT